MKLIEATKSNGEKRLVALCKYKNKNEYSFVNLITGNISPCVFPSEKRAIEDLQNYLNKGVLKSYRQIGEW